MNHVDWIGDVTENESVRAVAIKAGIPQRTLAGQVEKNHITAENVIAIAIAYNHHPVGALVDTGYLEEKWAQQIDPMRALREVSEDDLADETLRRMKLGLTTGSALDMPLDELITLRRQELGNYIDHRLQQALKQQNHIDDLAKRRHTTSK
ncbi:hypothetical protein UL82_04465 [Corynebacterium kutscheri]|uniref:Uncharacterized protein n=1 Tax=Corynebacterium kutscheri TaxID=35755 RepID=A0A0F6R047_9CORY|nr:hypothetical protein [Corynebacterium kutscheri]AKE41090.1 hypothetical protein UL82_04465 [Corynebacterium kutscheri]VEH09394.1 ribosomal protein S13 [Corynebacterium kutscheri]